MAEQNNNNISAYQQLKKLRTALAIAQGSKLLTKLQHEVEDTVSQDQAKRVTYLSKLFVRIHRNLFHDWKEQATVLHRPGAIIDAAKRKLFRETMERLVLNGNVNAATAIFDNNGFVTHTPDITDRLAGFYLAMRKIRPFDYGNRITLDLFVIALGRLPAFKSVYEQGIDFRRLDQAEAYKLHHFKSSKQDISAALRCAFDATRNKNLYNLANNYGRWPENKTFISGIPFLAHRTENGIDCLVTVNGGLMPIEGIKQELFLAGKNFADYPLSATENTIGYLPGTDALRGPEITEIDGIHIGENGAAPLFCLDVNMLTGLRTPSHVELLELIQQYAGEQAQIFELAHNAKLKQRLMFVARDDQRLQRTIEIAYSRLNKVMDKLEWAKRRIFSGKKPVDNPALIMSMGGAGSGKTAVEDIARSYCGENFVIASLDEFRKDSDLYCVLTAANHHSDDYIYVEPFANRLRTLVAEYARKKHFNLLYDGTGIPYQPRYANIIQQFKSSGFQTQIIAVDAFLVKPQGREGELSRSTVVESVKNRYQQTGRALPWVVTVDKHIRAPESFLAALQHQHLDKIALYANDTGKDQHYLVAESFVFSNQEMQELQLQQLSQSLLAHYLQIIRKHPHSVLRNLAGGSENKITELLQKNPALHERNLAYQIYPCEHDNRILVIYNARRMVDFLEKRQLNPNASGESGLLHSPDSLAFHVDPLAKKPWMTRLQDAES